VLGFLRRGHVFNRWFGRMRGRGGAPEAIEQGA